MCPEEVSFSHGKTSTYFCRKEADPCSIGGCLSPHRKLLLLHSNSVHKQAFQWIIYLAEATPLTLSGTNLEDIADFAVWLLLFFCKILKGMHSAY